MSEHHTHHWRERETISSEIYTCECGSTSAQCSVCERPSETSLLICQRCHDRLDWQLHEIARTWDHWDERDGYRQSSMQFQALGAVRHSEGGQRMTRPADVEDRLLWWVALWTEHTGAENTGPVAYLASRLMWASHNAAVSRWEEFHREVPGLVWAARHIVGTAPLRRPERCMYCGDRVVQDWADARWRPRTGSRPEDRGLSEVVRCTNRKCGAEWEDAGRFRFNTRQHVFALPAEHPDRLVTLKQAEVIYPDVSPGTMRSWVSRDRKEHEASIKVSDAWEDAWTAWYEAGNIGPHPQPPEIVERQLPERGRDDKGKWLYRLGDLDVKAWERVDDTRRGRPVEVRAVG